MLKIELRRAFLSKYFFFSLFLNFIMLIIGGVDYICEYIEGYVSVGTFLEKFLLSYGYGMTSLLAVLFPIITIVPYTLSYRRERDSGYYRLMVLKATVKEYHRAKIIAVISSAFVVFFLPCFLWLLICYFILGNGDTRTAIIYGINFASNLYVKMPFLYGMIYVFNAGLQGMVFSLLGLGLSAVVNNCYLAAVIPFCYCIFTASILATYSSGLNALSLFVIGQYNNAIIGYGGILLYDFLLVLVGYGLFIGGDKHACKG